MPARGERRRAYRGFTREPFDCCGKDAGPHGRPKGRLCDDCTKLVADGRALRQQTSQALAAGDRSVYRFHERDYAAPGYYGLGLPGDHGKDLRQAMFSLVTAVALPAPETTQPYADDWRHPWPHVLTVKQDRDEWGNLLLLTPAVRDAIDRLDQAIRAALPATYLHGKEAGRNVLLGLATGELSMQDFDDALLTADERAARQRARRG